MDFLVRIFATVALFYLPPAALVIGLVRMRKNYEAAAREPFTELPIRLAGQSTREKADTMWESAMDRLLFVLLGSPLLGLLSILLPFPNPHLTRIILFTAVVIGVAVVGFQIFGLVRKSWQYRLGALGEQVVGRELDLMMRSGYRAFHDVQFDRWNIDHVVVGPNGVFAVETKTRRKPVNGKNEVAFNGEALIWRGKWTEKQPIEQATRNAESLSKWIREAAGERVDVVPVVALPGWSLNLMKVGPVAVYSASGMNEYLPKRGNGSLRTDQIDRIAFQLNRCCQVKRAAE